MICYEVVNRKVCSLCNNSLRGKNLHPTYSTWFTIVNISDEPGLYVWTKEDLSKIIIQGAQVYDQIFLERNNHKGNKKSPVHFSGSVDKVKIFISF